MTSINTFQNILDVMEQDPALRDALRRHILAEEFIQFPASVARLETDMLESRPTSPPSWKGRGTYLFARPPLPPTGAGDPGAAGRRKADQAVTPPPAPASRPWASGSRRGAP